MQNVNNALTRFWTYIISHKWSKDILRGNILFICLVILYDLFHFHLAIIGWAVFFKFWILMNICYAFKLLLDAIFMLINKE